LKPCTVYSTDKNAEAEGVIIDKHILLPAPCREDVTPAHVIDGQCFYPPIYAVDFVDGMHHNLMPFSTECEWGEYSDIDSPAHNWVRYYGGDVYDYNEKWGYCDIITGKIRIPPEMKYCEDFNKYGAAIVEGALFNIINTSGDISEGAYLEIKKSYHGVFFIYQSAEGWGAVSHDGQHIEPLWNDIEWDGLGGFTVTRKKQDGSKIYGVENRYVSYGSMVIYDLAEKPMLYDFPAGKRRKNLPWDEHFHRERFRLTHRDGKFGLIRDVLENSNEPLDTYSELILEPIHAYDDIPDAAYSEWVDAEICYYARVLSRTPRHFPGREGDGWESVPNDIRDAVREYMLINGWKQPENVGELKNQEGY
jgi:hypothetical protein